MREFLDQMDARIVKKKLEKALNMLRTQSTDELKRKFTKKDLDEAMKKLNTYDSQKFKSLGIDMKELKNRLTDRDMQKIKNILGKDGEALIRKIKDFMR